MKPTLYVGKIVLAFTKPDQVIRGMTKPGAEWVIGAVIACKDLPDAQPGGIPNKLLTIRGQSGRTMEVDLVRHWCQLFDSWAEAESEKALSETPQTK